MLGLCATRIGRAPLHFGARYQLLEPSEECIMADAATTYADEDAAPTPESGETWRTELVRALTAARAEYLATHGRFLTPGEFEQEWAQERGAALDDEE